MEKIRAYSAPVVLIAAWMLVAGYVLSEVSRQPPMPTFHAPEVIIEVPPPTRPA
jgi:hypothetical protein